MGSVPERRILLVDDDAVISLNTAEVLRDHGYLVETVLSGERAVERACSQPAIDLVLMDINLRSGMDGTEAASRILAARELPIVFLSSHTEPEIVRRTEGITSYGYIVKHSGETVLLASIRMAFRLWEARQAQEQQRRIIRDREALYAGIFEYALDAIFLANDEGRYLDANPAACELTGYTRDELVGMSISQVTAGADPAAFLGAWREYLKEGQGSGEYTMLRKDGTELKTEFRAVAHVRPHVHLSIVRATPAAADFARAIGDTAPGLVYVFDVVTGRNVWVNKRHREFFGPRVSEDPGTMSQRAIAEVIHPEDFARVAAYSRGLAEGSETTDYQDEIRVKHGDGWIWMAIRTAVLRRDEAGRATQFIGSLFDISSRKEAERRLADGNHRLQALLREREVLLRETNHRIKNNLLTISSLLSLREGQDGIDLAGVRHQVSAIGTAHELLVDGASDGRIELETYLNRIIDSVVAAGEQIRLTRQIQPLVLPAARAVNIGLVVNELVANAVRHGRRSAEPTQIGISLTRSPEGGDLVLEVSNSGTPLPPDFEPSLSAGLGLRLVLALLGQLDGGMTVLREPVTTFRVRIPVRGAEEQSSP